MIFELPRRNQGPLIFHGVRLGAASTRSAGKSRWTEIAVYMTEAGRYVAEVIGRTIMEDEQDLHNVRVYDSGAELVAGLKRRGNLSTPAYLALDQAAEYRSDIAAALDRNDEPEYVD